MQLDVTRQPPPEYLQLVWDEFCASRNRGVSVEAHFSWMMQDDAFSIVLSEDGAVVGGLAVGPVTRDGFTAGRVGGVFVAATHRGQGHSTALIEAAQAEACRRSFDDLILWTGTPTVYERTGFRIRDRGLFGRVTKPEYAKAGPGAIRTTWPRPGEHRALPLFATGAYVLEDDHASIVVLSAKCHILAEWLGDTQAVLQLIAANLESGFLMNARQGDALLEAMAKAGWTTALQPSNLEMVCPLSHRSPECDPYRLRVLDRL